MRAPAASASTLRSSLRCSGHPLRCSGHRSAALVTHSAAPVIAPLLRRTTSTPAMKDNCGNSKKPTSVLTIIGSIGRRPASRICCIVANKPSPPTEIRYCLVASKHMVGIFLTVWVRSEIRDNVKNMKASCVGRGLMGYLGNKIEQRCDRVFEGWNEGRIYFPPTYKYSNNSDLYAGDDTHPKDKRRTLPIILDRGGLKLRARANITLACSRSSAKLVI